MSNHVIRRALAGALALSALWCASPAPAHAYVQGPKNWLLYESSSRYPRHAGNGTPVWIRGRIINTMDAGDSKVIVVHALEAHAPDEDVRPLVYHNRTWHELSERSVIADTVQAG